MTSEIVSENIYRLPFDQNLDFKPEHAPYHSTRRHMTHALDFAMPDDTPIFSTLKGTVVLVEDQSDIGGPKKSLTKKSNRILICHDNAEYTDYIHLRKGAEVKEGDEVQKGTLIGYSGSTGYTTYPHLHFGVLIRHNGWKSIIPRFRKNGKVVILRSPN